MIEIRMNATYRPSDEIVARDVEGELIIVPFGSGVGTSDDEMFSLNESGRAVWARLDGKASLQEIVRDLAAEYGAPAPEIERDVRGLVEELLRRRILVEKEG